MLQCSNGFRSPTSKYPTEQAGPLPHHFPPSYYPLQVDSNWNAPCTFVWGSGVAFVVFRSTRDQLQHWVKTPSLVELQCSMSADRQVTHSTAQLACWSS